MLRYIISLIKHFGSIKHQLSLISLIRLRRPLFLVDVTTNIFFLR